MPDSSIPDSLDSSASLRAAELLALAGSATAVVATVILVRADLATEANPVTAWALSTLGHTPTALVTLLLVGGIFAGFRRVRERGHAQIAAAGAWGVALPRVTDAIRDLWLLQQAPFLPALDVYTTPLTVAVVGVLAVAARPSPTTTWRMSNRAAAAVPRPSPKRRRQSLAVAFGVMLAVAPLAGVVNIPLIQNESAVGTASASHATPTFEDGFEDGDISEWSRDTSLYAATKSQPSKGSYGLEYTASTSNGFLETSWTATADSKLAFAVRLSKLDTGYLGTWRNSSGSEVLDIQINSNDNLSFTSGSSSFTSSFTPSTGVYYGVNIVDLDYSSDTYDVKIVNLSSGETVFKKTGLGLDAETSKFQGLTVAGYNGNVRYYDEITAGTTVGLKHTDTVSGRVVNQNGQPVPNATAEVWYYKSASVSQATQNLSEISDPIPDQFQTQLQNGFSVKEYVKGRGEYGALFTQQEWPSGISFDNPELTPEWSRVDAGERIVVVKVDASKEGITQDGIDEDIPGATVKGPVVIKRYDGSGTVTYNDTVRLTKSYQVVDALQLSYKRHHYGETTLPTGVYKVVPKSNVGKSGAGYYVRVGYPIAAITPNVTSTAGQLTEQAKRISQDLGNNLVRKRVTTNSTGAWSFQAPNSVGVAYVQAYKAPGPMNVDAQNATLEQMRDYYRTHDYNGSWVMPSRPQTVDIPSSNNTVRVVEMGAPVQADVGKFQNVSQWFFDYLKDHTYEETAQAIQERLKSVDNKKLEDLYMQYWRLAERNANLQELANKRLENAQQLNINASNATNAELRERIQSLTESVHSLQSTIQTETKSASTTQSGNASATITFAREIPKGAVSVIAHYPDGTSEVVPGEYISVDQSYNADPQHQRETTVRIRDFPLDGHAKAEFKVRVATKQGLGSETVSVTNPNFDGEIPSLNAVEFSTLNPGPSEGVRVTLHPSSDTKYRKVVDATVYGPDGNTVPVNITGARTLKFSTNGQGVHQARVTFQTTGGHNWTTTIPVAAAKSDYDMPPGIRLHSGPLGVFALTGDGLEGGNVEVKNGGSDLEVSATVAKGGETPGKVHIYTKTVSLAPDHSVTVRLLDESGAVVSTDAQLILHTQRLPKEAYVRVNGHPVPQDEQAKWGRVTTTSNGTRINTLLLDGSSTVSANANPSYWEQAQWFIDTQAPDLPFMSMGTGVTAPLGGMTILGAGLVVRRRSA